MQLAEAAAVASVGMLHAPTPGDAGPSKGGGNADNANNGIIDTAANASHVANKSTHSAPAQVKSEGLKPLNLY